jgi:hypothetical protein
MHLAGKLLWPVNIIDNFLPVKEIYLEKRLAETAQLQPQKRKFLLSGLFKRVTSLNRVASLCADDVIWAYRYFLKREPESSEVMDGYISGCKNLRQLVETITGSKEYEYKKYNLSLSKSEHADLHYFFHMHKTGGMSVHEYLSDAVPKNELFPGYFSEDLMSIGSVRDYSYLSGHFGNLPLMIKSRNLRLATTLRDPVQRGLSYYKHTLRDPALPLYHEATSSSLEEFVYGPFGPIIFGNFQARLLAQLSSQWGRFLNAFDTEINTSENLFELAMEGLEKIEVIGITENLEDFITRLSKAWGLPLPIKDYRINCRPSNQLIGVSPCVEEKIRALCAIDITIYEQTVNKINI